TIATRTVCPETHLRRKSVRCAHHPVRRPPPRSERRAQAAPWPSDEPMSSFGPISLLCAARRGSSWSRSGKRNLLERRQLAIMCLEIPLDVGKVVGRVDIGKGDLAVILDADALVVRQATAHQLLFVQN